MWRVTYLPTEPAIFRAIQATRFVMRDFFAVMVTVIMTSFFVTYHLGHKKKKLTSFIQETGKVEGNNPIPKLKGKNKKNGAFFSRKLFVRNWI